MSGLKLRPPLKTNGVMPQLSWLPPLNSEYNHFVISVNAKQVQCTTLIPEAACKPPPKTVRVELKVDVDFYYGESLFSGFSITRNFNICSCYNTICNVLLHPELVPFKLNRVDYREIRLSPDKSECWSSPEWKMVNEDALIQRLSNFLQEQAANKMCARLSIKKWIKLPAELLERHIAWYNALPVTSREKYNIGITSPRKQSLLIPHGDAVILRGRVSYELDTDGVCSVCLEGYLCCKGPSKLRRMSCSHVFHRECIARWLKTRPTCPICRQIVVSFSLRMYCSMVTTEGSLQHKKNGQLVMFCLPDSYSFKMYIM